MSDLGSWFSGAFEEIYGVLRAARVGPAGPGGGLYPTELFTDEEGEVVIFVPIGDAALEPSGRVRTVDIPPAELAVAVHRGSDRDADRTYAALGTYVAERTLGVEGPIREHYLVTAADSVDEDQLRTEICWPVFQTTMGTPPRSSRS
jgi:effector-binding domain-containing protein